jgi:hypothetical protein
MTQFKPSSTSQLVLASIVCLLLIGLSSVSACKCAASQRNVLRSFCSNRFSFTFRVVKLADEQADEHHRVYDVALLLKLRGYWKQEEGLALKLKVPKSSAACGLELEIGQGYIIYSNQDYLQDPFQLNSCSDLQLGREMTRTELAFIVYDRRC